jgi:hypothetical protein
MQQLHFCSYYVLLSHYMFRPQPAIIRCIFLLRGCYTACNLKFVKTTTSLFLFMYIRSILFKI